MLGDATKRTPGLPPADPVIELYKRDVDRTLLRRNLGLSVEDRFRQLMELQRFAAELKRAGQAARKSARK
jgi:hypothetical protein